MEKAFMVSIDKINHDLEQPRKFFNEQALSELATTIKEHGLIQPIVVVEHEQKPGEYVIVAGERRYRASKLAGLTEVPVVLKKLSKQEVDEISIIENIQREELNPIEEAYHYQKMISKNNWTQAELAKKVGKSQAAVANKIRLIKLEEEVQEALFEGKITERHARALLQIKDHVDQVRALNRVVKKELNVAKTEELVKKFIDGDVVKRKKPQIITNNVRIAKNTLSQSIDMIKKTGIKLNIEETEHDDCYEIKIKIQK